jgi:hypothetical protein
MVDLLSILIDPRDDDRVPEKLFEARSRCPLMIKQIDENRDQKRVDSNCAYLPNVENLSRKMGSVPLIEFCGSLSETEEKNGQNNKCVCSISRALITHPTFLRGATFLSAISPINCCHEDQAQQ